MSDETTNESTIETQDTAQELGLESQEQPEEINEELELSSDDNEGVQAETEEELVEEIEAAIEDGASKEQVESMIKEFELKVNGKTFTKKIDLSDEEALKRELQKAYAGQQAMQQKAELEKSLQERVALWKSNPKLAFEDLGMDVEDFLNSYMEQKIEESKKTPEQVEREKIQMELEEARRKEKELREQIEKAEYQRMREEAAKELNEQITEALDAHPDLPKSPRVVQKIADVMKWANDHGIEDVRAIDAIPTVKAELQKEMNSMFSELPLEFIESYIGKKTFDRFREEKLKKLQKKPQTLNEVKREIVKPTVKEEVKTPKKRVDDWMRAR